MPRHDLNLQNALAAQATKLANALALQRAKVLNGGVGSGIKGHRSDHPPVKNPAWEYEPANDRYVADLSKLRASGGKDPWNKFDALPGATSPYNHEPVLPVRHEEGWSGKVGVLPTFEATNPSHANIAVWDDENTPQ